MSTIKILQNINISVLFFVFVSCNNSFQKKIDSLHSCPTHFIQNLSVEVSAINDVGNHHINFYLTPIDKNEHYFYLKYKNENHFLYYAPEERYYSKYGLYPFSANELLLANSKKVKNKFYGKIDGASEFHYQMTQDDIEKEILDLVDNAIIISQDNTGKIIRNYAFCKNSNLTLNKLNIKESYKNGIIKYYPQYKSFDSIIIEKK